MSSRLLRRFTVQLPQPAYPTLRGVPRNPVVFGDAGDGTSGLVHGPDLFRIRHAPVGAARPRPLMARRLCGLHRGKSAMIRRIVNRLLSVGPPAGRNPTASGRAGTNDSSRRAGRHCRTTGTRGSRAPNECLPDRLKIYLRQRADGQTGRAIAAHRYLSDPVHAAAGFNPDQELKRTSSFIVIR
ncbi:hypothetical protein [Micromonospora schwarzwaldensis]|uniref:hypothetical protein n=1 Tax=Micromonospora sp. DSM 45708 TaxID=3111767 RepID=UPI0031D5A557